MLDKLFSDKGADLLGDFVTNRIISKVVGGNSNKEALMATLLMQGLGAENPLQNMFGKKSEEKA